MARELILKGKVQGVFCRKFCRDNARRMNLSGSATNLSDGSVRVLVNSDDDDEINRFVHALKLNPFGYQFYGRIEDVSMSDYSGNMEGDYNF